MTTVSDLYDLFVTDTREDKRGNCFLLRGQLFKTFWSVIYFRIDVTFEIRTVFYRIHLLIDTDQIVRQHFISNGNGGEVSKIAERQRESVCERQRVGERKG